MQREDLSSMFDYDLWANLKWREAAREMGQEDVLVHIVQAQVIWLSRVQGTPIWPVSAGDLTLQLERVSRSWKRVLLGADLHQTVSYQNSRGESFDNSIIEIVRHVINHGTYHRGQLRGIAEERGMDFPETDYMGFLREGSYSRGHAGVL
jgi:uncharacterized damage-inducible protein DinB